MAYVTLAEVKAYLNIPSATTDDDTQLSEFINVAQATIEAPPPIGTGRRFEAALSTQYFDAVEDVNDRELLFNGLDLAAITSVTNGDGTTISAEDYILLPRNSNGPYYGLILRRGANISWTYDDSPEQSIAVQGYWAYSQTAGSFIKQITLRLVQLLYRQRSGTNIDQAVQTENGLILPSAMPKDIREALAGLRSLI
jgi:hypothetical protein